MDKYPPLKDFVRFEVGKVQELTDSDTEEKYIERVDENPIDGVPTFWGVYGRTLMHGFLVAINLVDVTDETSANAVKEMLEGLAKAEKEVL